MLRHAVRSVLWQTYPHFELLVIGDGCTDDSEEVVASFGDERVRWHNLKTNTGSQTAPNNAGIERARGEYLAYQGHDDVWHPHHLAAVLAAIQRADADLAYSLTEVIGPRGSRTRYIAGARVPELSRGTWIAPASMLHRTELARKLGGWQTWKDGGGPPDRVFLERMRAGGARLVRAEALDVFKFPSGLRQDSYRRKASDEQERYVRRIERERLFIERELAGCMLRYLSPLKPRLDRPEPTATELADPEAFFAYLRRVRGLD